MSQDAIRAVLHRYPAGGSELLVAVVLADFADDDGQNIAPGMKEIARRSRIQERGVLRYLKRMLASGWLERVGPAGGGLGSVRRYRINPEWLASCPASHDCVTQPAPCGAVP